MSDDRPAPKARRPRREASATESLLNVVLIMEAVVVVFGALVVFGLDAVPGWAAFTGGAVLIVLLIVATRLTRYRWGIWFGHLLQLILLATVFIEVLAGVSAAIFVGFWIWSLVRGRQLDAAKGGGAPA